MYFQQTDKMDKLEEHIRKNREDLDRYVPSEDLWERIDRDLRKDKPYLNKWFSIVATVIVILCTGIILLRLGSIKHDQPVDSNDNVPNATANPSLKETEIYYNNLVNSLFKEASPLLTSNPEIKKELTTDISQLDSICTDIKKDLKDNVAYQKVVEALIQNYRLKIRLLEDMLSIMKENENNKEKTISHEL